MDVCRGCVGGKVSEGETEEVIMPPRPRQMNEMNVSFNI